MTEVLTESFCERCGTKYTFEGGAEAPSPVQRARTLVRGLRYYLLSDDPLDEALAEARRDDERDSAGRQLDAFHQTFNFCIECRQYVCGECWNEQDSRCLTCAPMPGRVDVLGLEVDLSARLGSAGTVADVAGAADAAETARGGVWPAADLVAAPHDSREAVEKVAAEAAATETMPAEAAPAETAAAAVTTPRTAQAETSSIEAVPAQATGTETTPVEMVRAAAVEAAEPQPAEPASIEAAAPPVPPRVRTRKAAAAAPPTPGAPPTDQAAAAAAPPTPGAAPTDTAATPSPAPTAVPPTPVWQIVAPEEAAPAEGSAPEIPPASGQQPPDRSSRLRPSRTGIFRRRAPAAPSQPSENSPWTPPTAPAVNRAGQPGVPPPAWIRAQAPGEQTAGGDRLWDDSSRGLLDHPGSSVQACVTCGLPLSATARFCRRCGAKQG